METISLKLPEGLLTELESQAKARGITKSAVIRESLEKTLRKESDADGASCYDVARDFAGVVKGLPEDIAVNPDYMDGFGK